MAFKLAELFVAIGTKGDGKLFGTLDSIKESLLGIPVIGQVVQTVFSNIEDVVSNSAAAFGKQAAAENRLDHALLATGMAAGYTSKQLREMAGSLEASTGTSSSEIMAGMSKLTSFQNVKGPNFGGTIKAALDMAADGFGDFEGNVVAIGKAMEDPLRGMLLLSRAGVMLNEAERQRITDLMKQGDLLTAQSLIMGKLNASHGGSAEALASPAAKLQTHAEGISGAIGSLVMPAVKVLEGSLDRLLPPAEGLRDVFQAFGTGAAKLIYPVVVIFEEIVGLVVAVAGAIVSEVLPSTQSMSLMFKIGMASVEGFFKFAAAGVSWLGSNWKPLFGLMVSEISLAVSQAEDVMGAWIHNLGAMFMGLGDSVAAVFKSILESAKFYFRGAALEGSVMLFGAEKAATAYLAGEDPGKAYDMTTGLFRAAIAGANTNKAIPVGKAFSDAYGARVNGPNGVMETKDSAATIGARIAAEVARGMIKPFLPESIVAKLFPAKEEPEAKQEKDDLPAGKKSADIAFSAFDQFAKSIQQSLTPKDPTQEKMANGVLQVAANTARNVEATGNVASAIDANTAAIKGLNLGLV